MSDRPKPLSVILDDLISRVGAIEIILPAVRRVLDEFHNRHCPECGRWQPSHYLDHHKPGCRLGDALAALVAAMPEDA